MSRQIKIFFNIVIIFTLFFCISIFFTGTVKAADDTSEDSTTVISSMTATLSRTTCTYNGTEKTPSVTIDGLREGTDYTVTYSDNVNAGTATVTITGTGDYSGTITKNFTIKRKKINSMTASTEKKAYVYTGSLVEPEVTLNSNIATISSSNYTLTYENNKNTGVATIIIKGTGNYTGTKTITFKIKPARVTIRSITSKKKTITVKWSEVSAANRYQIYISTSKNGTYKKVATVSSGNLSYKITGLKSGKTYYVKVRAVKHTDGSSVYGTFSTISSIETKELWVASLDAASTYSQLIVVAASGSKASVSMYIEDSDGTWSKLFSTSGYIGKNGLGKTKEGDGKTPVGIFTFTKAFGIKSNPGTSLSYTKVDSSYYWVDDSLSEYYNQFVSTKKVTKDWSSAEHIKAVGSAYNYVLAISYNSSCTPYAGSGIFLHCSTGNATAGCVSIVQKNMVKVLKNITSDCAIIIDTKSGVYDY